MSIEASPRIDEKGRMNVLLIICDQLRRDHLGYVGDPIVSTPNIDELAAQGTDFTRTYTCVPTCARCDAGPSSSVSTALNGAKPAPAIVP